MKPATTVRAPRSTLTVRAVARLRTSTSLPTATNRPPEIATAWARGWAGSMVRMLPLWRTSTASARRVGRRAKAPSDERNSRRCGERMGNYTRARGFVNRDEEAFRPLLGAVRSPLRVVGAQGGELGSRPVGPGAER